jgi:hypothetical protein
MNTDWKALCELLIDEWDAASGDHDLLSFAEAIDRARAALAQPEPQAPTDEEIDALVICIQGLPVPDADDLALPSIDRGRDMVRKALARWGHHALPVPQQEADR